MEWSTRSRAVHSFVLFLFSLYAMMQTVVLLLLSLAVAAAAHPLQSLQPATAPPQVLVTRLLNVSFAGGSPQAVFPVDAGGLVYTVVHGASSS